MQITFVLTFQWDVVLIIIGSLIFSSVLLYILEKNNPFYQPKVKRGQRTPSYHRHNYDVRTLSGAIICLYAILLNEGKKSVFVNTMQGRLM